MLRLLQQYPAFRRLWLADVVSLLGDWLTYVAVSVLALERGEGLVAVSLVLVAHALPSSLLAPFAGWVVDRFDRRQVMVVTSLLRSALAFGMAGAAALGSLFWVQALLLVRIGLAAFTDPAITASLPQVLSDPEESTPRDGERSARLQADLGTANRLIGASWSALFAFGVALGGFAAAFLGPTWAIFLDALTFLLAAWIASGLPALAPRSAPTARGTGADTSTAVGGPTSPANKLWADLRFALSYAKGDGRILEAALSKTPAAIVNGGGWVLLNQRAQALGESSWLATTALALGTLQCVRALGTGIGPLMWNRFSPGDRSSAWWNATTWCSLLGVAALAMAPNALFLSLAVLVWGVGVGANWVAATTRLQRLAPDHLLGRLAALDLFGHTLGQCAGALGGALVASYFAEPRAAAWTGVALGAAAWGLLALTAAYQKRPLTPLGERPIS